MYILTRDNQRLWNAESALIEARLQITKAAEFLRGITPQVQSAPEIAELMQKVNVAGSYIDALISASQIRETADREA